MSAWYMLTIVGRDQPGIVAQISNGLFEAGYQLGETSMMRLGGNFTMMLMVSRGTNGNATGENVIDEDEINEAKIKAQLQPCLTDLDLRVHLDPIEAHLHEHITPNLRVSVYGADRPGIVARVTNILQQQDFNILDLESDVAGSDDKPIYIMHIEGVCQSSADDLEQALNRESKSEIDIKVFPIDTLIG